jgi:Protein of unknown function (DUF2950)
MSYAGQRCTLIDRMQRISIPLLAIMLLLAACEKSQKKAVVEGGQPTFASPEDAGAAVLVAAKSGDPAKLLTIFGRDAKDLLFTGDSVKDQDNLNDFISSYDQMHRWGDLKAGGKVLYTGADNYPFPIPLAKNSSGQWIFDTAAGKDEILARRIGKDELTAIAACDAAANAENQYFNQTHDGSNLKQYAQKFVSDDGKQNGLYWAVPDGQAASPLGDLRDFAKALGYTNAGNQPQPFNGYYFRILTRQGSGAKGGAEDYVVDGKMTRGFAILAFPVEYRNSGIMTFIVGRDGIVYQKDLGETTSDTAAAMTEYNPGDGWNRAL